MGGINFSAASIQYDKEGVRATQWMYLSRSDTAALSNVFCGKFYWNDSESMMNISAQLDRYIDRVD